MRLWHYKLIPFLPRQQLLGQHRECCALRGNGWGKKHSTVDYVFNYSQNVLCSFHHFVMREMMIHGYKVSIDWLDWKYRGKSCPPREELDIATNQITYPEHDEAYLQECIENLRRKGIEINV